MSSGSPGPAPMNRIGCFILVSLSGYALHGTSLVSCYLHIVGLQIVFHNLKILSRKQASSIRSKRLESFSGSPNQAFRNTGQGTYAMRRPYRTTRPCSATPAGISTFHSNGGWIHFLLFYSCILLYHYCAKKRIPRNPSEFAFSTSEFQLHLFQ